MSRISKTDADQVSRKLVQKIQDEITSVQVKIENLIIPLYEATIPVSVKKAYKEDSRWFRKTSSTRVRGTGIQGNYKDTVDLRKEYPSNTNSYEYVELNDKNAAAYTKLYNKKDTLEKKKDDTEVEIYNLLLSLGTWKRALKQLPEIAPYAPVQEKQGLMIVPKKTKEKIACLVSTTDNSCLEKI